MILVPLMKYPKTGGVYFVWALRHAQTFAIYFFNPCFRVLHEGDEYYAAPPGYHSSSKDLDVVPQLAAYELPFQGGSEGR